MKKITFYDGKFKYLIFFPFLENLPLPWFHPGKRKKDCTSVFVFHYYGKFQNFKFFIWGFKSNVYWCIKILDNAVIIHWKFTFLIRKCLMYYVSFHSVNFSFRIIIFSWLSLCFWEKATVSTLLKNSVSCPTT